MLKSTRGIFREGAENRTRGACAPHFSSGFGISTHLAAFSRRLSLLHIEIWLGTGAAASAPITKQVEQRRDGPGYMAGVMSRFPERIPGIARANLIAPGRVFPFYNVHAFQSESSHQD